MKCSTCINSIFRKYLADDQEYYVCELDGKLITRLVECGRYEEKKVVKEEEVVEEKKVEVQTVFKKNRGWPLGKKRKRE